MKQKGRANFRRAPAAPEGPSGPKRVPECGAATLSSVAGTEVPRDDLESRRSEDTSWTSYYNIDVTGAWVELKFFIFLF